MYRFEQHEASVQAKVEKRRLPDLAVDTLLFDDQV